MKQWKYNNPTFECDQINEIIMKYSPWVGHRSFAYDLIQYMKPKNIVELGSHYGCSTYAMLQAIKDFRIESTFYAVDTWAGDDYTKNDYENDVYIAFCKVQESLFQNVDLVKVRKTFDEALSMFQDRSIELLHIDGNHTYEAVKNDYERWKAKVSDHGIIMFHDISTDKVFGKTMGSHLFWEELKAEKKYTIEFDFSYGLGVLFHDSDMYESVIEQLNCMYYQRINNELGVNSNAKVREMWFELNSKQIYNDDLKKQIQIKDVHLERYQMDSAEKQNYIDVLLNEIEQMKLQINKSISEKDEYISTLEKKLSNCEDGLHEKLQKKQDAVDTLMKDKVALDKYARECEEEIARLHQGIEQIENDKHIADEYIKHCESEIAKKDQYIGELEEKLYSVEEKKENEDKDIQDSIIE